MHVSSFAVYDKSLIMRQRFEESNDTICSHPQTPTSLEAHEILGELALSSALPLW